MELKAKMEKANLLIKNDQSLKSRLSSFERRKVRTVISKAQEKYKNGFLPLTDPQTLDEDALKAEKSLVDFFNTYAADANKILSKCGIEEVCRN